MTKRTNPLLALGLLALVILLGGCNRAVRFSTHAPYPSRFMFDAPLVIVVPDTLEDMVFERTRGRFPAVEYYDIHVGQAFRIEAQARFQRMFDGVAIVRASEYPEDGVRGDELDRFFLGASGVSTSGQGQADAAPTASLGMYPGFVSQPTGYLLRFHRVDFGIVDDRAVYLVTVTFSDRATGEELGTWQLRAAGREFIARATADSTAEALRKTVLSATTPVLLELQSRVANAIVESSR